MTTKQHFRALMFERRAFDRSSAEHLFLTRAGRKFVWLMRGIPSSQWSEK